MSSSYFKSLDETSRRRYMEKLTYEGLDLPDPLDSDIPFRSKRWPNISRLDIYAYLVEKHGMYSRKSFKDYTSLPCYNYMVSKKIKAVECYSNEIGISMVRAIVESSQKIQKFHQPWIIAGFDGEVLSAHCTCMAGLGETCTHVGAVLFLIEKIIKEQENPACTSEPCKWNRTSKNVKPSTVADIDFKKPRTQKSRKECNNPSLPVASDAQFKTFLQNIKSALPSAVIFSAASDSEETDTAEEDDHISEESPSFISKMRQFMDSLPQIYNFEIKKQIFQEMFRYSEEDLEKIQTETLKSKKIWFDERHGRLTASNFGKICRNKFSQSSLLLDVMGYKRDASSDAITWGKTMENVARDKFSEAISPLHVNLHIQPIGLIVDSSEPYLAATPDGLVTCDCCEDHLLEIKCPFIHRRAKFEEIEKKNFFLDENLNLKESHPYFDQIQGQMAIAKVAKCYFVIYTEEELHFQIITLDELRWETSRRTLKKFFFEHVLPEATTGKILKEMQTAGVTCICKTEKRTSTIKCIKCNGLFHRTCVKYFKRASWICRDCV